MRGATALVHILIMIVGMSVVTILPRLAPIYLLDRLPLKKPLRRWLTAIPYAVLGALIVPGVLYVDAEAPAVGLTGALTAAVLAYRGTNMFTILVSSIVATLVVGAWMNPL